MCPPPFFCTYGGRYGMTRAHLWWSVCVREYVPKSVCRPMWGYVDGMMSLNVMVCGREYLCECLYVRVLYMMVCVCYGMCTWWCVYVLMCVCNGVNIASQTGWKAGSFCRNNVFAGIRTLVVRITSPTLYRLSYRVIDVYKGMCV